MKFVALVSGGKDSVYSAMEAIASGHTLVCAANLAPAPTADGDMAIETDSYMYQTAGHDAIASLAECLGVPLIRGFVHGKPVRQDLNYSETAGDEVEDLAALLQEVQRRHPEVNAVCSGAILSNYQRLRVENVCSRLGLTSLAYLWQRDQADLLRAMLNSGVEAVLVRRCQNPE